MMPRKYFSTAILCLILAACSAQASGLPVKATASPTFVLPATVAPAPPTVTRTPSAIKDQFHAKLTSEIQTRWAGFSQDATNQVTLRPTLLAQTAMARILSYTPTPAGRALWKDEVKGFGVYYPQEWQQAKPEQEGGVRFEGENGYFELKAYVLGTGLDAYRVCNLEMWANPGRRYSAQSELAESWGHTDSGNQIVTCAVRSKDRPLKYPQTHYIDISQLVGYFVVETGGSDQEKVQFTDVPLTAVANTPVPLPTTPLEQPITSTFLNFTMKQWRIAPANRKDSEYIYFSGFGKEYPAVTQRYQVSEENDANDAKTQLKQVNSDLAPFGYALKSSCETGCKDPAYQLLRGTEVIKDDIKAFGSYSAPQDRRNFSFGLFDQAYQGWLLTKEGIQPYDLLSHHYHFPMYVGDHLISLEGSWDLIVVSDGQPVFTWHASFMEASPPVPNELVIEGQWALEIRGMLVVGGEIWNITRFTADDIFNVHYFDSKLFFFYRRGQEIGIYYDGQTFPTRFTVIHHEGCCAYSAFNPFNYSHSLNFFAIESGMWNYVEITMDTGLGNH